VESQAQAESPWEASYRLETAAQYAEAAQALDHVAAQHEEVFIYTRRGWLSYLQAEHTKAIEFYQHALEKNPKSLEARLGITLPLLATKRWDQAASYARQVIADSAWDYLAHQRLLAAEEGMSQWRVVAQHAEQLNQRYPSDAGFLLYLARANAALGKTQQARDAYARVLNRIPTNSEAHRYLASP